jgi:hypothetical protein
MSKLYNLEDSYEASCHFRAMKDRIGAHNIPLKRELYVSMYDESVDFIRGFMLDFDTEEEEYHYPSGHRGTRRIVKFWKVVPCDKWKEYQSGIENTEKEKLIIWIPFHVIDFNNVTYD